MKATPESTKSAQNYSVYDVIISGAGPVGLFLAGELALANCSVLILEKAESPHSPLKQFPFGIRGLFAPTVEALYRRGLLQELEIHKRLKSPYSNAVQGPRRQMGHFAGIPFHDGDIDRSQWKNRLPNSTETSLISEMEELETVLTRRAESLGVTIRRGLAVTRFHQSEEGVTVYTKGVTVHTKGASVQSEGLAVQSEEAAAHTKGASVQSEGVTVQSGEQTFQSKWLVGCDGSRSVVRKAGGFEFAGTEPEFTGYSAKVEIADPEKLRPGRNLTATGMYLQSQPGYLAIQDFDGGAFHGSDKPITREHVQEVLRRISDTDVTISALHFATTWTDRARQATTYRNGRLLLAGDAAHIHAPLGGQGLNLGLGDAMNLGWKLAATIQNKAPEGLLDSYYTERYPIGAEVLDWSRAQVAIMKPDPNARALNAIIRDLINTRDGATYMAARVWGIHTHYPLGDNHPLAGYSTPDFELQDGARIGELLHDGLGILLDFESHASLQLLASEYGDRIKYVTGRAKEPSGLSAALIRPDGIIAWASDNDPDISELQKAAARWFISNTGI